jgi:hypothetical protein
MFLKYGVNEWGELVGIDQVQRGYTGLKCPYCRRELLAKKGAIKVHHFAHAGKTCRAAARADDALDLPAYDSFRLHLTPKEWEGLQRFHIDDHDHRDLQRLETAGLIKPVWGKTATYELTHKGKVPFGELSLMLFNDVQYPLIIEKHDAIVGAVLRSRGMVDHQTYLSDLRIYRAQMQRILSASLYFLHLDTPDQPNLYKIGVTLRDLPQRIVEIERDLAGHFKQVKVEVIGTWPNRGNIEHYFKHRYRGCAHQLGTLTEYFIFEDVKPVLRDLRRMKEKEFTDLDREILAGHPSPAERGIIPDAEVLSLEAWMLLADYCAAGEDGLEVEGDDKLRLYNKLRYYKLGGEEFALVKPKWYYANPGLATDEGRAYKTAYEPFYQAFYADHYAAQRQVQEAEQIEARRREAIRSSMKRVAAQGKHVGRPTGSQETREAFLSKPDIQKVITLLQAPAPPSLRIISQMTGVAVNTIQKVKRLLTSD